MSHFAWPSANAAVEFTVKFNPVNATVIADANINFFNIFSFSQMFSFDWFSNFNATQQLYGNRICRQHANFIHQPIIF